MTLESGADATGRLTHRVGEVTVNNGAYNHFGPAVMGYGVGVLASTYRVGATDLRGRLVYTNSQPGGQFRGYGGVQATFALESQVDELAAALGMDPLTLRLANAN
jgi:CO/xanthine dehydrogenase Mo-binding subunit